MGCGSSNTTTQTTTIPKVLEDAYTTLINRAQTTSNLPLQQYTGQQVAGFSPQQTSAFNAINAAQGTAQPYINAGAGLTAGAAAPVWPNVPQYSGAAIDQYMNPWLSSVVGNTASQLEHDNAVAQNDLRSHAVGSGAYGGDRAGVAAAELARGQGQNFANTISGLYSTGFNNAQSQFNTQQNLALQGLSGDANRQLQAGQQIAGLGTTAQNAALSGASAQLQAGALQQQQNQAELNVPYQQFLQRQQYPFQTAQFLGSLTGNLGNMGSSTSTTTPSPSLASQLGGLGLAGLSLFKLKRGGKVPGLSMRKSHDGVWRDQYADGGYIIPGQLDDEDLQDQFWTAPPGSPLRSMLGDELTTRGIQPKPWGEGGNKQWGAAPQFNRSMVGVGADARDNGDQPITPNWRPPGPAPDIAPGLAPTTPSGLPARPVARPVRGRPAAQAVPPPMSPPVDVGASPTAGLAAAGLSPAAEAATPDAAVPPVGADDKKSWLGRLTGHDPNLALLAAGLGMAAGTSPNALTNIGAGGLQGVNVLMQQRRDDRERQYRQQQLDLEKSRLNQPKVVTNGKTIQIFHPETNKFEDTGLPTVTGEAEQARAGYYKDLIDERKQTRADRERLGLTGGAKGQTSALVKQLMDSGEAKTPAEALAIIRDPAGKGKTSVENAKERLALQAYAGGAGQFKTLDEARQYYGIGTVAPAAAAAAAGAPTMTAPPVADRVKGQTYDTPKGKMYWTGTGWVPVGAADDGE